MNRTQRFLGGVSLGYAQQLIATLTGLWLTPFLLHHIGQFDYGLWLAGFQILAWLTLMDFGIVALLPRETAYALGRAGTVSQAADLPRIVAEASWVVLCQSPFTALAAAFCWFLIPVTASPGVRGPAALVACAFALTFPLRIFRAVLEGLQDLVFLGRAQALCWIAGTIVSVVLVVLGLRLYALAVGWVVTTVSTALACLVRLRRIYPGVLPARLERMPANAIMRHCARGFWLSLAQLAQVLLNGTDLLVIGKVSGASAVVPYACTGKMTTVLSNQPLMLMHAATPGLSAIQSSGDRNGAFRVVLALTEAMLLLSGAIVCIVLAVNSAFVSWWVGSPQYGGFVLTLVLAIAMLLRHWNSTAVASLFCFGRERRISITTLIDGLVSIAAAFLLVRRAGAIGAPLGSVIGLCLVSLPANLTALSKETQRPLWSALLLLWPWFWRFLLVAAACGFFAATWTPADPAAIAATVLGVGAVYTLVMFPMTLRSSLRSYLPRRAIGMWSAAAPDHV
jgi:O-antigen/teichoic acid export membrane protein